MKPVDVMFFNVTLFIISTFSLTIFTVLLVSNIYNLKGSFEESKMSLAIKITMLIYLVCFSIFFIAILLDKYKVIEIAISWQTIKDRFDHALYVLPYAIKLFSCLLILSFYDEMNSVYVGISVTKFYQEDRKCLV